MNYSCFLKDIAQRVRERVSGECTVEVKSVRKNNGIMQECMIIRRPQDTVSANIYLSQIYEKYLDGMTMDQAAEEILCAWHSAMPAMQIDADQLINADIIRSQVVYRLVNHERNAALLETVPHKDLLDLTLVYYVLVHSEEMGEGAILVQDHFLEYYGLTLEEVDEAAGRNTPVLLPVDFIKISDLLREFGEKSGAYTYSEISLEEESVQTPLYVLTNKSRMFGAYYMTDRTVLGKIAEQMDADLYLLPSSVHECMVVSAALWEDPQGLAAMVQEINRTQVSEDEYLADSVYRFGREDGSLVIAA